MSKAIFLDIDGVLNCDTSKSHCGIYVGVDTDKIKRLAHIVEETDAIIILSSDWRFDWKANREGKPCYKLGKYLDRKLWKCHLKITDSTPDFKNPFTRGIEIEDYLKQHPEITEWVVIDDIDFEDFYDNEYIQNHIIITNYKIGLTDEDAEKAIEILMRNNNDQYK